MTVPSSTIDLIKILKERYPDVLECNEETVGTPEYWKKVGIIELLRELEYRIREGR